MEQQEKTEQALSAKESKAMKKEEKHSENSFPCYKTQLGT